MKRLYGFNATFENDSVEVWAEDSRDAKRQAARLLGISPQLALNIYLVGLGRGTYVEED